MLQKCRCCWWRLPARSLSRLGRANRMSRHCLGVVWDEKESGELVRQIVGTAAALSREVVDDIVERTDGVPLFLEELTKAVVETVNSGANAGKAAVLSVAAASPAVP